MNFDMSFYQGKRVFLTGHTGFKGSWMSVLLANAGAEVIGYSSCAKAETRLFDLCGVQAEIRHLKGDVRDMCSLLKAVRLYQPEIVVHMAAQPIVRDSYRDPVNTYETNVMGTVNLLEAVRQTPGIRSVVNVTTDKVYENQEWVWGYRENERLNGFDPYSNSKSCSELVTQSYINSFFAHSQTAVSTVRAGNVIGGGDFAHDRILPDCVRAAVLGEHVVVRNPHSIRPYQHVLEAVCAYLMIAACQYENRDYAGSYNVGPDERDCIRTDTLVELFTQHWGGGLQWFSQSDAGPHEANFLKLDCSKIKAAFDWRPRWDVEEAVEKTVEWSKVWADGGNVRRVMDRQIREFLQGEAD